MLVKGMVFFKGKQGVCFDIPTASVTEVQEKWYDSRHWQLSAATEQPEPEGPREGCRSFRGQQEEGASTRAAEVSGTAGKRQELPRTAIRRGRQK